MAGSMRLSLIINADGTAAIQGINRVRGGVGDLDREADRAAKGGLTAVTNQLKSLAMTAAAGIGVAELARAFITAATESQRFQASLTAITGSTQAAGAEMEYIRATADKMGLKLGDVATAWISLSAAAKGSALEGQAARDIFESVSLAMGKLGKSSADTQGALLAIEQMISKGVVSAEELRGQLGERLPGAFKAAADAMGRTEQELGKMLESGEVMAEDLLPLLSQRLNELYNDGKEIGGLATEWNRLTNALSDMAAEADRATGATNLLADALRQAKSLADVFGQAFTAIQNARAGLGLQNFASDADKFNATMGVMLEKQREFQMLSARVAANQDSLFLGQYEAQLRRAGDELGVWTQKVAAMQSAQVAAAKSARDLANQQAATVGDDMVKRWEAHRAAIDGSTAAVDKLVTTYDKQAAKAAKVKEAEATLNEAVAIGYKTREEANAILREYTASLETNTKAKSGGAKATRTSAVAERDYQRAIEATNRAVQGLIARYLPARQAAEDYKEAQKAVNAALAGGEGSLKLSAEEASTILAGLAQDQAKAADAARREADAFYAAWADAVDSLDDTFKGLWRGLITGQGDVLGNLKETVLEWVADLSYQLLLSPLIVPIQGALMGIMGGGAAGVTGTATSMLGTASSLGSMFSGFSSLASGVTSLFSGATAAGITAGWGTAMAEIGAMGYGGAFTTIMGQAGSLAASGNIAASIGAAAPYLLPAIVAIGGALAIFNKWQSDQEPRYGTLAAMTGGRAAGLEDAEWGAASGAYVKGSFGLNFGITDKGSKNMEATELTEVYQALADVSDALAEFFGEDLSAFIEAELQKMSDFGDGLIHLTENEGDLGGAMAALVERIAQAAGRSAEDIGIAFGAMVGDLSGTAEEVGEQIQAAMLASSLAVQLSDRYDDDLGQMLDLTGDITADVKLLKGYIDQFGASGETSGETLSRLVAQLGVLDTAAQQTATNLEGLSATALLTLSDELVGAFGSLDAATQAQAFYYDQFTTQTEKLADAVKAAAKTINREIPKLQDELMKLSEDVITEIVKTLPQEAEKTRKAVDALLRDVAGGEIEAFYSLPENGRGRPPKELLINDLLGKIDEGLADFGDTLRRLGSDVDNGADILAKLLDDLPKTREGFEDLEKSIEAFYALPADGRARPPKALAINDLLGKIDEGLVDFGDTLRRLGLDVDNDAEAFLESLKRIRDGVQEPIPSGGGETITTPGDPNAAILAKLLDDLPKTREGFEDLMGAIDLTTEAGRKLYAGLLELAPQFDLLYDGAEAFTDWLLGVDEVGQATRELEAVFKDWGMTLPDNREALVDLYDSGILTTEQMAILGAYLKELGLVFGDLKDDVDGINELDLSKLRDAYAVLEQAADAEREAINAQYQARMDAIAAEREALDAQHQARLAAIASEREAVNAAYQARMDGIAAEREAAQQANQAQLDALAKQREAAQEALSVAEAGLSRIQSALDAFRGDAPRNEMERMRALRQLGAWARAGTLPGEEQLDRAITGATNIQAEDFGTEAAYRAAQGSAYSALLALEKVGVRQVSDAERQIAAIETASERAQAAYEAQLKALDDQADQAAGQRDAALEILARQEESATAWRDQELARLEAETKAAQTWRDENLAAIDDLLELAAKQIAILEGTYVETKSLAEALKDFNAALIDAGGEPLSPTQADLAALLPPMGDIAAAANATTTEVIALRQEIVVLRQDLAAVATAQVVPLKAIDERLRKWDLDGMPSSAEATGTETALRAA